MALFRRQAGPAGAGSGESVYRGLRRQLFDLDPAAAGMSAVGVWGAVMELGMERGTATIVGLADGTTSMYTSSGGGTIGAGQHASARAATALFVTAMESAVPLLAPVDTDELPSAGIVQFLCLHSDSPVIGARAPAAELQTMRHALSPLYIAGQNVVTAIRLASPR